MADQERQPGKPVGGDVAMAGDVPLAEHLPQAATAAIHPVTAAMLDHAAHEAAVLADDVAHGGSGHASTAGAPAAAEVEPVASVADRVPGHPLPGTRQQAPGEAETAAGAAPGAGDPGSRDALSRYNAKLIEIVQSNMSATGDHVAALARARSVPEAAALNADHLRRQIETLTTQGRELAILAQQALFDAFRPFRDGGTRGR